MPPIKLSDLSVDERKSFAKDIAREIVKQFLFSVDVGLGRGLRKYLTRLFILLLLAGGIYFGVIKLPGVNG